jgi:predicted transport protein
MHENKDITIEAKDLPKMLEQLEEGFYAIPVFQREFVWEVSNIKSLWDSIYRHYPIGSFLIWETEEKIPKHRKLFNIELKSNEKGNFNYILDGQQRITSLLGSIKGAMRTTKKTFTIFFDLKKALNEKNKSNEDIEDSPFLDEDEYNKSDNEEKKLIIPVSYLMEFNTPFYKELLKQGSEELADFYHDVCDRLKSKYKLSIIRLNKIPIDEVCEIFTRVNQRGKKLTLVELMTAKTFKQETEENEGFYLRDYLDKLNEDFDDYIKNYSDAIDETIFLRIISVVNSKTCREKELLSLPTNTIMQLWTKSSEAYKKAIQYMKEELRIDSPYLLPYPPMLAPLAYFFSKLNNRPLTDDIKKILNSWFWINSFSGSYQGATNEKIHQDCEWFDKVLEGETKINIKFSKRIEVDDLINQELNLNNAFCKSVLCVLSYLQPKDFYTHKIVNINEIFIKSKKDELHHIFPVKSEVGKKYRGILINSIVNICFLPKDTNVHFSNKNPKDYLMECQSVNKHFVEDIQTHLMPIDETISNNFENFLKIRSNLILTEINTLLGVTSDIHKKLQEMPDEVWNEYELEIRKVIDTKLSEKHGADYWKSEIIPEDIKNAVNEKVKKELKLRPDLRPQFETSRAKLDNCDVMDYLKVILKNWDIFEDKFGSKEETQIQFKNLQVFRNALKHIKTYSDTTTLDELTKKKGEVALLWLQKILKLNENQNDVSIDFTTIDELDVQLKERILSLGQDIKVEKKKYYTAYKKKSNFVCSQSQNSQIKLWIRMPKDKFNDPRKIAKDMSHIGHHGTGNFQITFSSKDDLNYIIGLIKQSYEEDTKSMDNYNLEYLLKRLKNKNIIEKLNQLMDKMKHIDPGVVEYYSKYRVNYKARNVFCTIGFRKDVIIVQLKMNRNQLPPTSLDIRSNEDKVWTTLNLNEKTNLEDIIMVIKKAFELNKETS